MPIRVLLADDHALFRDGVAALLSARGIAVVAQAADGIQALDQARELQPDLILMDINMPRLDGLAATRILTTENPNAHVIILTISDGDENLFEAIKSGAQGYLLKNTETDAFFAMLEGVTQGEAPISRLLAGKILREFARINSEGQKEEPPALSERENQVLSFIAEGLINREIAARINLSENTVKYHLKNILQKLHLRNRAQAVAYAMQSGLLKKSQ